jgi:hypothetical protein
MCGATDKAREAMIAFLKSGELKAPRAVVTAPGKEAAGVGFLTASFAEGTLFLKSAAGEHYRLEWPKRPQAPSTGPATRAVPDRRRALPPGEYTLTGYRIVRRDAKGVEWFLSASAPDLRRLVVRAGEEQPVQVTEAIRLTGRAQPHDGGVKIQLKIAGEQGSGLSIYREGKRIEIGYRLTDAQEKELARGTMQYG